MKINELYLTGEMPQIGDHVLFYSSDLPALEILDIEMFCDREIEFRVISEYNPYDYANEYPTVFAILVKDFWYKDEFRHRMYNQGTRWYIPTQYLRLLNEDK